jgi:predicted RNA-binding Zn-ribbon protein involved in translation (DUF1610 family)
MTDEQLVELRDDYDDLTEIAQPILRDELRRRALWPPPAPQTAPPPERAPAETAIEYDISDILNGGITIGTFDSEYEAGLAGYALELAKIQSGVATSNQQFGLQGIELRVAPDDGERAIVILSKPMPDSVREDYEAMKNAGDFELPTCPKCGSQEVLLVSAEPSNQWECDVCGHAWQDPISDAASPTPIP